VPKGREFLAWWPEKRAFTQQSTLSNQHDVLGVGNFARGSMAKTLTVDDILPLVASLTPHERVRLLRLIALPQGEDAPVYRSVPPSRDEFSADDEPLAWDADGWEDVG
jgi:hypothetical protein